MVILNAVRASSSLLSMEKKDVLTQSTVETGDGALMEHVESCLSVRQLQDITSRPANPLALSQPRP